MDKDVDQDLVQDVYERWDSAECRRCVGGGTARIRRQLSIYPVAMVMNRGGAPS